MRKLEHFVLNFLFPAASLYLIVCDFLHEQEWMSVWLQFGPFVAVAVIILLLAALDKRSFEEVERTKEDKGLGWNRFLFIIILIVSLNLFWGEPRLPILDISRFEFWLCLIILPIVSEFDFKKKTDNIRG